MKNYLCSNQLFFTEKASVYDATVNIAQKKAPFSKVLIVACQKDIVLSNELLRRLKRAGRKVTQVIILDGQPFSVKNACGLFCTVEDIRLVIAIGKSAGLFADYFSTIKSIPAILIVDYFADFFKNKIYIKSQNGFDGFIVENVKTVITDGQLDTKEISAYFALCKFKLFCYYARTVFTGEDFDRKKVFDAFYHILEAEKSPQNSFNLQTVSNFICKIPDYDPTEIVGLIFDCSLGDKLRYAEYITGLLCDAFIKGKISPVPDYNQISETVSTLFGFNQSAVLKSLSERKKILFEPKNISDFTLALENTDKYLKNSAKNYFSAGVKRRTLTEEEKTVILFSGDTPLMINVLSVYKEYPF